MKVVRTVIKGAIILILGFLIGVKYDDKDNRQISLEEKYLLRKVVNFANKSINHVNCELHDNNGLIEKPLVADYLTEYLSFSYYQAKNSFTFFYCDENNRCDFVFGLEKHPESYSRILSFSYDKEKKTIYPNTFSCYDVP